jgi:hypothetical protein
MYSKSKINGKFLHRGTTLIATFQLILFAVPDADPPVTQPAESIDGTAEVHTVQPQTGVQMGADEQQTPPSITNQNHAGSYVRLDDCVSSQNEPVVASSQEFDRQSLDSIPNTPPPPIPLPVDPSPVTDSAFSFEPDDLYKVPPRRDVPIPAPGAADNWYDVPPAHNAVFSNIRRDSTSSSAKRDSSARGSTQSTLSEQSSMSGPNEIYDVPPTRYQLDEVAKKTSDVTITEDIYDIPPVRTDTVTTAPAVPDAPPRRPPRPTPGKPAQSESRLIYENVPPNSRAHPNYRKPDLIECKQRSLDEIYDFPKPQPNNGCLLVSPPPPPNATSQARTHNYINASSTVVNDDDDAFAPDNSNNNTKLGNDVFATVVPTMNRNGDLQALRDSAINDNIYQVPPSNAPVTSARLPVLTQRGTPTKKPAAKGRSYSVGSYHSASTFLMLYVMSCLWCSQISFLGLNLRRLFEHKTALTTEYAISDPACKS